MLRNYLKIAFRNIWKNKTFSLINILGLSIGLSASFVIGAMVFYDLTFDKFHTDGDRIYRVTSSFEGALGVFYNAGVTVPLAQELKELRTDEIETVAPFFTTYPLHVANQETGNKFKDPDLWFIQNLHILKHLNMIGWRAIQIVLWKSQIWWC